MIVDITCFNCAHSWETNTSTDPDPYLCHNCGLDNLTMQYEPEKLEAWKRSQMKEEKIPGGKAKGLTLKDLAKYHKMPLQSIKKKLDKGIKVEMEHTTDKNIAREIAMDHIYEDPNYYTKLKQIETEGTCGYTTDTKTGEKLTTPGGLEEDGYNTSKKNMDDYKKQNNPSGKVKDPFGLSQFARELAMGLEEADPKTGTGKKPKGSGRRLYTDEDPTDTVSIKFKTKEDIVDTLNSASFKSKSHARQSQVINLIHQRVRAAYQNAKDPETKARLKRGLDYIEKRKEASKEKTKRLQKLKEVEGGANTSWTSTDNETITLQDILELTKDIKVQNFPTKELASIVLNWDNNPEEIEKISQVEVSSQYPILIMVDEQGKIQWILDGNHRAQKALSAKAETIPAKLIKPSNLNSKARKILLGLIDENLTEKKGSAIPYGSGYKKFIPELTQYMYENGMNIKPFPKVKFINDDEVNANDPLGMTAYYDPANTTIVLYTMGRHPKDILRSFAHEMVHHEQNLNNAIGNGIIKTTNTLEDDYLEQIEREAYEKGNIMLRNWTDSLKK